MAIRKYTFQVFSFIFEYYARFICYINFIKQKYSRESHIFFKVNDVYNNQINITNNFLENKYTNLLENKVFCFEWTIDNVMYKQYLNGNTLKFFVPYTFFEIRNMTPDNKIIAALLTNNETKEVENITSFVKEIAGPKQNFYKDFYNVCTKDVFDLQDCNLQIITTNKSCYFDLSKDNILEL